MAEIAYNRGKTRFGSGLTNGLSSDLRALIIAGASLPAGWDNPDLNTVADLAGVAGLVIHTERLTLATLTVTQDDVNERANLDSANLSFAAAVGVTARALIIFDQAGGGTDNLRYLLCGSSTGWGVPMDGGVNVTVNDWARLVQC